MENKAKYTLVGLFIFTLSLAMVAFILWLARYDVKELNAKEFRVYSKTSIAGLNKNSIVEYKGLDIGLVKEIRINPKNLEQVEIILKITTPEVIKTDSFAIIQSQGVTGNKIIEIDGGTLEAKQLIPKEGSFAILPLQKSFLDKITSKAGNIGEKIESVLSKFEKLLNEQNIENFNKILDNTNNSTKNFNEMVLKVNSMIENELQKTIETLNKTSLNINQVVVKDLTKSLNKFNTLSDDISNLSVDTQKMINKDVKVLLENLNTTINSSKDIDKVLYELDNTLQKINQSIQKVEDSGGDMIFKTRETNYGPGEKNE